MARETRIIVGPHSIGVTVVLSEQVTVYAGFPPPAEASQLTAVGAETYARRSAARALRLALEELEVPKAG